jgi:hypothetical protein
VAQRVDLNRQVNVDTFGSQLDQAVKNQFPVLVAGEVIVGDEKALGAFGVILPDDALDIVRGAPALLPPLHIDDRAE